MGPIALLTPSFGLVSGRVASIALDPADATGNHVYLGTTGGGVWVAQNAATQNASSVMFTPLTDTLGVLEGVRDASISIGALTVQPGGTGVVLAGTGDPNDALDSYYGVGILRSADGGTTWSLIQETANSDFSFEGEGFAGFAWSTVNPQFVVAAVSQAVEGTLVNANWPSSSYEGIYYSQDAGVTWNLATLTDNPGQVMQGPSAGFVNPDGNAATSVVWNPVRRLFLAAVRFHGYYQSADGMTWTRMPNQPGAGLAAASCPSIPDEVGSIACPIFRGTLAVNPQTGDTFAWTVDLDDQDQGLWQDACALSAGACSNPSITFASQWSTQALETNTVEGAATIENGDYSLALAAAPAGPGPGQDTILFAGATDLWRCSLAAGCVWRNTTNATTCMSAGVAPYQHAVAWAAGNPQEILIGNDGGLWRSLDSVGETGQACSAGDSAHFQNLNGALGSLAEVDSLAIDSAVPDTMLAGLGVNGTAGGKSAAEVSAAWPQILGGDGGPVAIDPSNPANWFVNAQAGVSIYRCAEPVGASAVDCSAANFGTTPVVSETDVGDDGLTMTVPAQFLVDPADPLQLLIGTCRVWRGPAAGNGWTGANAISPILDNGATSAGCNGDGLIRSIAAMPTAAGEVVYVGMYGWADGGANAAGHVFRGVLSGGNATGVWTDLTLNPVTNDGHTLNYYGFDISGIFIDASDPTGNTAYVTVAGIADQAEAIKTIYRTTDGGSHWAALSSNLPLAPANGVVVDPLNAQTIYVATDVGVFLTTQVSTCPAVSSDCWSLFGTGLPPAPVVALSASATTQTLSAATYGRGIWQTPLWTAGVGLTTAAVSPPTLTFGSQAVGTVSSPLAVTLTNTEGLPFSATSVVMEGDFTETDNCQAGPISPGSSCQLQVVFVPTATGNQTGQIEIFANVDGGQLAVELGGSGTAAGVVSVSPASVSFGQVEVGTNSSPLQVEVTNSSSSPVPINSITITQQFVIASNACGTASLAANAACQLTVAFAPTAAGQISGTLTITDGAGSQTVLFSGTGAAAPTDLLAPAAITFPTTVAGQLSVAQAVTLTNTGDLPLIGISTSVSGPFQLNNNCGPSLTGHADCALSLFFAPTQTGAQTGALTVTDALRQQVVALSGVALAAPALTVSPSSLSFPTQQAGAASAPQTVSVSNSGGSALANIGFQISGQSAGSFSTGVTNCGATLAAGATCLVTVIYTPATTGPGTAALNVTSSTQGVLAARVSLSGFGEVLSGLNASPAQLNFGSVEVGSPSAAQTVTLSNTSSYSIAALQFVVTSRFSVAQSSCVGTLGPASSCTAQIIFTPSGIGAATGTLTVTSASSANVVVVPISGIGASAAGITVSPPSVSFGTVGVGQTSAVSTVTVTNPGIAQSMTGLALSVAAGFTLTSNTCGPSLAPGASCTVGVVFAPASAILQTGSLTVSSGGTTVATAALAGTGFDFTVAVSASSSLTIASGQAANFTVILAPLGGSQGTFSLTCGSLPQDAACIFNPAAPVVASGSSGNVALEITTGSTTALLNKKRARIPLICGLILLPFGWRKRRRLILLVALLLTLTSAVTSCTSSMGGTSGGGSGNGGSTSPGIYSIPITATSNSVQHAVTVTLTVD